MKRCRGNLDPEREGEQMIKVYHSHSQHDECHCTPRNLLFFFDYLDDQWIDRFFAVSMIHRRVYMERLLVEPVFFRSLQILDRFYRGKTKKISINVVYGCIMVANKVEDDYYNYDDNEQYKSPFSRKQLDAIENGGFDVIKIRKALRAIEKIVLREIEWTFGGILTVADHLYFICSDEYRKLSNDVARLSYCILICFLFLKHVISTMEDDIDDSDVLVQCVLLSSIIHEGFNYSKLSPFQKILVRFIGFPFYMEPFSSMDSNLKVNNTKLVFIERNIAERYPFFVVRPFHR